MLRHRIFTITERAELWRRYKAGESILGIARALGPGGSAVHCVLECSGGMAQDRRRGGRVQPRSG